jgi:hypothetical protein
MQPYFMNTPLFLWPHPAQNRARDEITNTTLSGKPEPPLGQPTVRTWTSLPDTLHTGLVLQVISHLSQSALACRPEGTRRAGYTHPTVTSRPLGRLLQLLYPRFLGGNWRWSYDCSCRFLTNLKS